MSEKAVMRFIHLLTALALFTIIGALIGAAATNYARQHKEDTMPHERLKLQKLVKIGAAVKVHEIERHNHTDEYYLVETSDPAKLVDKDSKPALPMREGLWRARADMVGGAHYCGTVDDVKAALAAIEGKPAKKDK